MGLPLLSLAESLYTKIFKAEPSEEVRRFIRDLSWVFVGVMLAKFLMLIVHSVGGRIMGSVEYGKLSIIIAAGEMLLIPATLFICGNALIKYYRGEHDIKTKERLMSSSSIAFVFSLIFFTALFYIIREPLASFAKIELSLMLFAIVFSAFSILMTYSETILRALMKFKKLALIEVTSHILLFFAFGYLYATGSTSFFLILLPLIILRLFYFLFSIKSIKVALKSRPSFVEYKKLFNFNIYIVIPALAVMFASNIDKLMLNYYVGPQSAGLYQAYFFSSTVIMGTAVAIFLRVFFPTINKFREKMPIFLKINKLLRYNILLTPAIMIAITYIIVRYIYNYPLFNYTLLLFGAYATLLPINMMYSTLLTSTNLTGAKEYFKGNLAQTVIHITLNIVLIKTFYITGALIATIIGFSAGSAYYYFSLKNIMNNETD